MIDKIKKDYYIISYRFKQKGKVMSNLEMTMETQKTAVFDEIQKPLFQKTISRSSSISFFNKKYVVEETEITTPSVSENNLEDTSDTILEVSKVIFELAAESDDGTFPRANTKKFFPSAETNLPPPESAAPKSPAADFIRESTTGKTPETS